MRGRVTVSGRVAVHTGGPVFLVCKVPLVVGHQMAEGDHQSRCLEVPLTVVFDDLDRMRETRRPINGWKGGLHVVSPAEQSAAVCAGA